MRLCHLKETFQCSNEKDFVGNATTSRTEQTLTETFYVLGVTVLE